MLKHTLKYFILFCCITTKVFSQTNLVPNPSFESYTMCPSSLDQMNFSTGWSSYATTPDYYNACSSTFGIAPPNTAGGYIVPHSGSAIAGIITFDNSGTSPNYREIIGAQLTTSLQIGTKYFISFYSSKASAIGNDLASNKIGVKFSKNQFSFSSPYPINNLSHVYTSSKITTTGSWIQVKGAFIADSSYSYIMVGNFFNDLNTDTISTGQYNQVAYYFIDDVCVSTDSLYSSNWTGLSDKNKFDTQIEIYPNPCTNFINLEFSDNMKKDLFLYNAIGNLLFQKSIASDVINYKLDVSNYPTDVYILFIKSEKNITRKKVKIISN